MVIKKKKFLSYKLSDRYGLEQWQFNKDKNDKIENYKIKKTLLEDVIVII